MEENEVLAGDKRAGRELVDHVIHERGGLLGVGDGEPEAQATGAELGQVALHVAQGHAVVGHRA